MTAAELARTVVPGDEVDWRRIEVTAFSGCPDVLDAIDPFFEFHRQRRIRRGSETMAFVLLTIVALAFLFAPVAGLATVLWGWFGDGRPGPEASVPIAAVLFLAGGAALVVECVVWVRTGWRQNSIYAWHANVTWIVGVLTIAVSVVFFIVDGSPIQWGWCLLVAAPAVFGFLFARGLVRQSSSAEPDPMRGATRAEIVSARVDALPVERRERVRDDIAAAWGDLHRRGVIDDATIEKVNSAPLGTVGLLLDPPRPAARTGR